MPFVERPEAPSLSASQRQLVAAAGPMSRLAEVLSHLPEVLEGALRLHAITFDSPGALPRGDRLMVAMVTARALGCDVLVGAYADAFDQSDAEPEVLLALRRDYRLARLSQRQRALLDFALLVTDDVQLVGKVSLDALRADAEIDATAAVEVVHITGLVNYFARLVVALGI